jgi:trans-aconitate methyltransferase
MRDKYAAYQSRYRTTLKESDKELLALVSEAVDGDGTGRTIVDIGCHTGNLLFRLKQRHPRAVLVGWDIFPPIIESCRADPELAGIEFEVMNVLDIKPQALADVTILSAVLFRFGDAEHETAWRQIHRVLKPGGYAVVFDWYHPYRQTVRIVDETDLHPEGLTLNMRSQDAVRKQLLGLGFASVRFLPFKIGIDLECKDPGDAVSTHTRKTADGERLQFRGVIYQPWCYMVATKSGV